MVTTRKEVKHESVRFKRIVLDLPGVILIQGWLFSLNMNSLFYLELKTGRGVIQNMETMC